MPDSISQENSRFLYMIFRSKAVTQNRFCEGSDIFLAFRFTDMIQKNTIEDILTHGRTGMKLKRTDNCNSAARRICHRAGACGNLQNTGHDMGRG
jgi:hypothetical protein